jgi:hypothetical protein
MQGRRTPAILRDRQAGEELAQNVFVKAYQRLDTFAVRRPTTLWRQVNAGGFFRPTADAPVAMNRDPNPLVQ